MIGLFDSGSGGLTILQAIRTEFTEADLVYLGDHTSAPYGDRSAEEIFQFTKNAVSWLFDYGCDLVILACNTASAVALRRLQKEWLPTFSTQKKVLGILVPTVEALTGVVWQDENNSKKTGTIGVLATSATVLSGAYRREIQKRAPQIEVIQVACPKIVPLIEAEKMNEAWNEMCFYIDELEQKTKETDRELSGLLLGCTHYAFLADQVIEYVNLNYSGSHSKFVYEQGKIVADSLVDFLQKDVNRLAFVLGGGKTEYFTTADKKTGSFFKESSFAWHRIKTKE